MSIIKQISSSIKTKKMSLEDKIAYLESLYKKGIKISEIPSNFVSEDGIIVNNVVTNIKKYYEKQLMTIEQTIKCENLGINFQEIEVTADFKIDFLMKAIEEGYNLVYIIQNHNKYINNCIYKFIEDLRDRYEQEDLNEAQTDKCINTLNIIIPKDKRRELALNIIRECALKNITSYN